MITWSQTAAWTKKKLWKPFQITCWESAIPCKLSNFRKLFESGYRQITGNDGSNEWDSQLNIINAIKVLTENSFNDNCVSSGSLWIAHVKMHRYFCVWGESTSSNTVSPPPMICKDYLTFACIPQPDKLVCFKSVMVALFYLAVVMDSHSDGHLLAWFIDRPMSAAPDRSNPCQWQRCCPLCAISTELHSNNFSTSKCAPSSDSMPHTHLTSQLFHSPHFSL